ncbi:MAG TPA: CHAT domain-containing protein, partial [Planctomycetota bacterium]|nr:CHAT domain-containing protein [Planctomycetota bacterium]
RSAEGDAAGEAQRKLEELAAELDRRLQGGEQLDSDRKAAFVQAVGVLHEARLGAASVGEASLDRLARAARVAAELGMGEAAAWLEMEIGYALMSAGRPSEAAQHLERALAADSVAGPARVEVLVLSSNVTGLCGEYGLAMRRAREALEAIPGLELDPLQAARLRCSALCALTQARIGLGLTDRAAESIAEARELASRIDDPRAHFDVASSSILFALATEDYEALERQVQAALQLTNAVHPSERGWLLVMLGQARAERERMDPGRPRTAAEMLVTALDTAVLTPADRLKAQVALARVQLREGRWCEAEALVRAAREASSVGGQRIPEMAQLAALSASVALERGATADELERELASFRRDFEPFLAEWASAPLRKGGIAFLHFGERRAVVADLVRLTLATHGPERGCRESLELLFRLQGLGTLARELEGDEPIALDEALRLASGSRGILLYLSGFDRSYVFAVDARRTSWAELPAAFEIERRRFAWLSELATPDAGNVERAARERDRASKLSEALLPPSILERVNSWTELLIDGQESLGYVPFELLPDRQGICMGLEKEVSYLPSFRVGALLERRSELRHVAAAIDLRLLASPLVAPETLDRFENLEPLPWEAARSARLRRLFRRTEILTGREANVAALERQGEASAHVLEVIAHGVSDYERERPSGLVLASAAAGDEGVLWSEDVERLMVPPLVVLGTCGAARGPLRRGDDGVSHLGGAFLRAGAQAVVLSPVDLALEPTLELLDEFNRGIARRGESPARALMSARRKLAGEGRPVAEYGLMHVLGLGSEPVLARPRGGASGAAREPGMRASLWALALLGAVLAGSSVMILAARRRGARR